jgi:hypothetical protein
VDFGLEEFAPGEVNGMAKVLIVSAAFVLAVSSVAIAGSNPNVKVGIHVLPHDPERWCYLNFPVINDPSEIVFTYEGCEEVDFFPVFFDLNECLCVEYAVVWPGNQTCSFNPCSYSHIGEIIEPGDWIAHCWDGCKTDYAVIPGWGEVTMDHYGLVCLAPTPESGRIGILDCNDRIDTPIANFCAGVCGRVGEDPLQDDQATVSGTWGGVKSMFR